MAIQATEHTTACIHVLSGIPARLMFYKMTCCWRRRNHVHYDHAKNDISDTSDRSLQQENNFHYDNMAFSVRVALVVAALLRSVW
jgi:hypothetical protein